ncbi:hypothetical protein P171DRAFT_231605 [Karstenula rhodostoma CBS 690.94]|uniref:Uncharacterized protein n=1 Tax=Karstenula rhodostoma CBS 690.94 TaxID=1392251 RepID=A0A9P4UF48_9PLEO|nr:hypothetical protein P171DRAFT_231605 [Karstenula rhodostoma CBS 690.94]
MASARRLPPSQPRRQVSPGPSVALIQVLISPASRQSAPLVEPAAGHASIHSSSLGTEDASPTPCRNVRIKSSLHSLAQGCACRGDRRKEQ